MGELDFLLHQDLDSELVLEELGGLMSLREAASTVGVSVEAVRLWVKRGQVKTAEWDGETWVVERSLYDCELERRRQPRGRRRAGSGQS